MIGEKESLEEEGTCHHKKTQPWLVTYDLLRPQMMVTSQRRIGIEAVHDWFNQLSSLGSLLGVKPIGNAVNVVKISLTISPSVHRCISWLHR